MHGAANEPVRVQLAPERGKLTAAARVQDGLRHTKSPTEAGHNAADGSDFDLSGGIANKVDLAVTHAALNRNPTAINRDARALPFQRLHSFFFEEASHATRGVAAVFADDAESGALGIFRDQPVKIRSVVGNKPDA